MFFRYPQQQLTTGNCIFGMDRASACPTPSVLMDDETDDTVDGSSITHYDNGSSVKLPSV